MQVANPNNIKIYNLSSGKSLPEFINDAKRRSLQKEDLDLRRRIELIQDFSMPSVSTKIRMSRDQNYIFASGTYKPCVKCFDVKDLSLKFERFVHSEVVNFDVLSEDFSKIVFLMNDRHVELHTQQGRHHKVRIPKVGRDLAYHTANCDLFVVGSGREVYRLNLDQGRFLKPFDTKSQQLNRCTINEEHQLVMVGGTNGTVECWDPRSKCCAGILDCSTGLSNLISDSPQVTALKFKDPLHLAVGTSTGQVLLYDVRSNLPYVIKDHHYDLPIHSIDFNKTNELVISSDQRSVKLWNENSGEAITAVEMKSDINDLHVVAGSGLFFLANESPKIHTYFIPMLGPAPKWCSFLDNLIEEMEENPSQEIYDDYKFLTRKETETLGLSNLIGSPLLRAYMHGYFVDMRLYHKAMSIANPFAYSEYRKKKIAEKIEEKRANRVIIKKLPKVNKQMADRLITRAEDEEEATNAKKRKLKQDAANILQDSRFKAMFEDPSFQVDQESQEYKMLNPIIAKKFEKLTSKIRREEEAPAEDLDQSRSDDDDEKNKRKWIQDHKSISKKKEKKVQAHEKSEKKTSEPRMFEIKSDEAIRGKIFSTLHDLDEFADEEMRKENATLEDRILEEEETGRFGGFVPTEMERGGKETTFYIKKETKEKKPREITEEEQKHLDERKKLRRPAGKLQRRMPRTNPFFRR